MDLKSTLLVIVAVLVALNFFTGNFIAMSIQDALTSPEGEIIQGNLQCMFGGWMFQPVRSVDLFGTELFFPLFDVDDIIISIMLTVVVVLLLTAFNRELGPLHYFLIFVGWILALKSFGLFLIVTSGVPTCMDLVIFGSKVMEPFYIISLIIGIPIIAWTLLQVLVK